MVAEFRELDVLARKMSYMSIDELRRVINFTHGILDGTYDTAADAILPHRDSLDLKVTLLETARLTRRGISKVEQCAAALIAKRSSEAGKMADGQDAGMSTLKEDPPRTHPAPMGPKSNTSESQWTSATSMMRCLNEGLKFYLDSQDSMADWTPIFGYCLQQAARIKDLPVPHGNLSDAESKGLSNVPFRFLDLPVEIRHMVYALAITPDMIEDHVARMQIPALLQVSQRMREEFGGVYFSCKVFHVEFFELSTRSWQQAQDDSVVRSVFRVLKLSYSFGTHADIK